MRRYPPGSVRPRVFCWRCGRSIAVTFNGHTGEMYARAHVREPGARCPGSGAAYRPGHPVHYGVQTKLQKAVVLDEVPVA